MFKAVLAFTGALVCLHIIGYVLPSGLTWGFHFLAFLPPYALALYLAAIAAAILYAARGNVEAHLAAAAAFMDRRPARLLIGVNAAVAAAAFFLHVRVPLLGDGFLVINNFANTLAGAHSFQRTLEPFAFLYFYSLAKLLGTLSYPALMWSFQAGEALLMAGFTVNLLFIVRGLFRSSADRLLVFALVLALPTTQLFFGYAESYAVVVYFLSLYLLAAVLAVNERIPFWVVFPAFAAQVALHLLNVILLPSFLYLVYYEYRKRGMRNILPGVAAMAAMLAAILAAVEFDLARLFSRVAERHYLPLFRAENATDAYALFSAYHAADLLNLLALLSPGVLLLLVLALARKRRKLEEIPFSEFFLLILIPLACFAVAAKFELGMFKDWDITATYLPVLALCAGSILLRDNGARTLRAVALVVLVTAVHTLLYITLNSSVGPSTRRYRAAIDGRTMGRDTRYLALQHLSQYAFSQKDLSTLRELWGEYIAEFPEDWHGYQSLSHALTALGDRRDTLIPATFERWMRADGDSSRARNEYAGFLIDLGLDYYQKGMLGEAEECDRKAIALHPAVAVAYNNLGLVLSAAGRRIDAAEEFRAAISVDSNYTPAYINLANAYDNAGNADAAIAYYREALRRDPGSRDAYENLGITYLRIGRRGEAAAALRRAAALGSRTAQELLRQNPSL
jgi:tetratricopeptide (TPR) repeat protein